MPGRISVILIIELGLILLTILLLTQPGFLLPLRSEKWKVAATWAGMIVLCATFCWSIILGVALTLNGLVLSI